MNRASKKLRKWRLKWNKLRRSYLWGAPGMVHQLFDAPIPSVERTRVETDIPPGLTERIAESYTTVRRDHATPFLYFDQHKSLVDALERADLAEVERQLRDLFVGEVVGAMGDIESYYFGRHVWRPGFHQLLMTDRLLNLGEALGVLPRANHTQLKMDEYVEAMHADQVKLFADIEDTLGFSLEMPLIGNPPIFRFGDRATSADMVRHAYVAERMRRLGIALTEPVLEIGGGFGRS